MVDMKKKFITIAAIVSFVALSIGYSYFCKDTPTSTLLIENIEALASEEGSTTMPNGPLEGPFKCGGIFNSKHYWVCKAYLDTNCKPEACK